MKAAVLDAPGELKVMEIPEPQPNEREVLIQVNCCGLCGSDVKIYQGKWTIPLPRVLGHEFVGRVVSTGKEVDGFEPGDRVSVDPNETCGTCEYCRTDRPNFCTKMIDHGILVDGGFAELTIAGQHAVYKLPATVSLEEGSFLELLSCCVHCINRSEIKVGQAVAVFGGGPAGQVLHQLATSAGAGTVHLFTHSKEKLDLARKLGVTEALNPDEVDLGDFQFDVVIDAVGSSQVIQDGLKTLTKNGRLMAFGQVPEGQTAEIDLFSLLFNETSIIPTFINPYTMDQAFRILEKKQIDVQALISHVVALEDIQRGFDIVLNKEPGAMKVLIRP